MVPPRHRPKRSLGQNFLVDPNLQRKIASSVEAGPTDTVLEIGPGMGALTDHLADAVGRLVMVELDDRLAADLTDRYADRADIHVIHGDILEVALGNVTDDPGSLRVVGNIPYTITTPILFHLLRRPRPRDIVLMVQEEVADRIVASAGSPAYGALSVGVQSVARAEKLFRVGRKAFRPVPKVDSAILRITPLDPPPATPQEEDRLREVVRAAFQWRRKQMGRILRDHPDLGVPADEIDRLADRVGFSATDRPETLSPEGFARLAAALP